MTPDEVRNAREKLNRTSLGLAVLLDVSPEAVESWEQGTAGGLVYSVVRAPLQRWGRAGDRDGVSWGIGAAMAVVFGAVLGHSMFRAA